jgi:YD repeat-containing protein
LEKIFYLDDNFDSVHYSYNNGNKLIEKKLINSDNETESIFTYTYQESKILNESEYDSENQLVDEKNYEYDEKGNLIKYSHFNSMDDITIQTTYEYDENNNRTKILNYDNEGNLISRSTYKYNDSKQVISLIEDTTLQSSTYQFEYDTNGKVISQKEFTEEEEIIATITYTYDGNEIIETQSEGEGYTNNYIIKSEIEYYENE